MGSLAFFPDFFFSEGLVSAAGEISEDFCSLPASKGVLASAGLCSGVCAFAAGFVSLGLILGAVGV